MKTYVPVFLYVSRGGAVLKYFNLKNLNANNHQICDLKLARESRTKNRKINGMRRNEDAHEILQLVPLKNFPNYC